MTSLDPDQSTQSRRIRSQSANMEMTDDIRTWKNMAQASIYQGVDPDAVFRNIAEAIGSQGANVVRAEIEKDSGRIRNLREPRSLTRRGIRDWYAGPLESHLFWPSLESYLLDEKGWPTEVVRSIDEASSKIVGMLQPPGLGEFNTKGLVLGHVQSGKTANFTAVIAKAADVQYRLFIVLSGLHNTLRGQTQKRLDRELAGLNPRSWVSLTDAAQDFGHLTSRADALLSGETGKRFLAVVKKNSFRLDSLRKWLASANETVLRACPVLIIDDEADQASLNSAKYEAERTRINQLIIEILGLLPKHAYVGYTATPFANVLVDPGQGDDLYPRDFIIDLPKPDGYLGTEAIFGRRPFEYDDSDDPDDGLDIVRRVGDKEVPHLRPVRRQDREAFEPALVPSLEEAIRYFWLATAARCHRGQEDQHSSMLVHTSVLTRVHDSFGPFLEDFRDRVLSRFQAGDDEERKRFERIWQGEVGRTPEDPAHGRTTFDDVWGNLERVVTETLVCIENNRSMERLDYEDEHRVRIVVGGNTLSRGLTLEGLVVSYFVRSAGAYDTLLQMGRWFGYRHGYSDLPRIWMTDDLEKHFRDLALVEEEIRRDIQRYEDYDVTPEELAVRIRVHPTLAVTSRLKMQAARPVQHSYSGDRPQTILFEHRDLRVLRHNQRVTRGLFRRLTGDGLASEQVKNSRLFRWASPEHILEFFREFHFHPENQRLRSDLLLSYVSKQLDGGRLTRWTVGVVGKGNIDSGTIDLGFGEEVPLLRRSRLRKPVRPYAYVGAIMSPGDQSIDLEPDTPRPETDGLLLIYPIDRRSEARKGAKRRTALDAADDVIGVAVVFPTVSPEHDTPSYVAVDLPPLDIDIEEEEEVPVDEALSGERM